MLDRFIYKGEKISVVREGNDYTYYVSDSIIKIVNDKIEVKKMDNMEFENMIDILKNHEAIKYTRKLKHVYNNIAKLDEFYFYIKAENGKMDVEYMSDVIYDINDILYNRPYKDDPDKIKLAKENTEIQDKLQKEQIINFDANVIKDQISFDFI